MSRPLYVGGRGRIDPCRRYDPVAPDLLTPARRVEFSKHPPVAVRVAVAFWAALEFWADRRNAPIELRSERKRVPFGGGGRNVVVTPPASPTRKPHGEWWRWIHRAAQVVAEHTSVLGSDRPGGGLAGEWVGSKFKRFFNGNEWAALVGCTPKVWSQIVGRMKNRGWIKERRQRRDTECAHSNPACESCRAAGRFRWIARVASFCVTDRFWMDARGAWGHVAAYRAKLDKKDRKARQAAEEPREHPPDAPELAAAEPPEPWPEDRGWWKPPTR